MPQISAIEPQKKKTSRFNIFLDGKFAFGISDYSLLENNLKVGKNLEEADIAKIIKNEQGIKLIDLASNFLSYRLRSEKEVRDYITKKIAVREEIKFQEAAQSPLIEKTITTLKKYKYLDDLEFARWFVASRTSSRPKGQAIIKLELKRKGIDEELINKVLARSTNELDLAKRAVEKKIKRWKTLPHLEYKKKFYQYLASRGFNYDTIGETFAFFSKKR